VEGSGCGLILVTIPVGYLLGDTKENHKNFQSIVYHQRKF